MAHRKRRLILRIFAALVLLLLVLMAGLPLWFPWVLRPVAKSFGLGYGDYEREGYSHFRLSQLTVTTRGGTFRARQVQTLVPTVWFWKIISRQTGNPFLQVSSWSFEVQTNSKSRAKAPSSVYTNINGINKTLAVLRTWAPNATLTNGSIQLKTNLAFAIPEARWRNGDLTAKAILPGNREVALHLKARADGAAQLHAAADSLNLRSDFVVANNDSGMRLEGILFWVSNRIELNAGFGRAGIFPKNASLRAEHFEIPGDVLKLEHYRNVTGSLQATWGSEPQGTSAASNETSQKFRLDLTAIAAPLTDNLPPIDINLHASGNTNSVRIDTAKIALPWLNAELSEGTQMQFSPPFLPEPAQLKVFVDLAKQSRFPGAGTLQGNATVFPSTNRYPRVSFALIGNGISVSNLQTRSLEFAGELDWPSATIASSRVTLTDGSEANLIGRLNLASNMVEHGEVELTGAFGRQFLPTGYSFETISLKSEISGPFTVLNHSGKLELRKLRLPNFYPLQLAAEWKGSGIEINRANVRFASSNAVLKASASLAAQATSRELTLSNFSLHTSRHGDLELERPVRATFGKIVGITNASPGWRLTIEPLRWSGGERVLELTGNVNWPARGAVRLTARNIGSELLEDFLPMTNALVTVDQLAVNAGWTNGPITFTAKAAASMKTTTGYGLTFAADTSGGTEGIYIQQFSISSATQTVCRAEGSLPFVLHPSSTNGLVQIKNDGALQFHAFTESNSVLWTELGKKLPLNLDNPDVRVDVSGTWTKPQGRMTALIERMEIRAAKPLPVVSNVKFDLQMDRESAVAHLDARVQEQPVVASAKIPLGQGFWAGLRHERHLPDFQNATGELSIPNAKLAAFVDLAPEILAPQGEFNLKLKLERGNKLLGEALIYNAGTRPVASLGPVRAIDARILFSGTELALTNLSAEIGGQRITATGHARIAEQFWRERTLPEFQLHLMGTNIPLARQASVLVRADLDLAITNSLKTTAMVAGHVRLHDSFFLSSIKDLAPGRVASPKRRPPFFSIETEPFATWRLGVQVEGEKFLKARSPFFNGTVSTTLRVEGTLKEPLAWGEVRINSGAVTFPFGSLDVQQGFVSLTSADPYHPQLFVNAGAQRMGYDIKMEASGPADQPVLQFSSSPPLSSEQIVLMLTTGQMPQGIAATSTRQRAQGLAVFVGKNLLSDLGIGGDGDGRLTIRSGEQLTETGRPTYDVEYKLNDDWSIVGEYDRFNQYNLGMKWRVYSK